MTTGVVNDSLIEKVPNAPTFATASAGDTTASLTWKAPTWDGGGNDAIKGYTIQYSTDKGTSWTTVVADTASTGSSTAAVYCTKSIVLETASTSLDVRLTSNIRSTSDVKVYYRILGSEDDTTIDKVSWTPFNLNGEEDITITPAEDNTTFKEYKYSVSGLKDFTTFQLKIGMTGSVSSYPPIIRDMRAVALAV